MSRSCPSCQAALTPKSRFCPVCGTATPLEETISTPTVPSRAGIAGTVEIPENNNSDNASRSRAVNQTTSALHTASMPSHASVASLSSTGTGAPPANTPPIVAASTPPLPPPVAASASRFTRSPFADGDCPFVLAANFNHALVAGYASTIGLRITNEGPTPLENVEIYTSCSGFEHECTSRVRRVVAGGKSDLLLEVEASRAGHFKLRFAASWDQAGQRFSYRGERPLRIYKSPDNPNINISIGDIQSNTGSGANQGLGAEYGEVHISNLIANGAIKTFNDLLDLELPDNYQPIGLDLDYELSSKAVEINSRSSREALRIPPAYLATAKAGSVCTLEPVAVAEPVLPFRLVARPVFTLGRSRADADFIAWVLPRNAANDELSKRVSKVHAIVEADGEGLRIRDNASANGTQFDGMALDQAGAPLARQGRIKLSGAVDVNFDRLDSSRAGDPPISNLRQWSGPDVPALPQRGAVRFEVVASEPQPLNAVWLLSDASFGSNRSNAIAIDDGKLAEIQGRFHYFRGCFWLENTVNNGVVRLVGQPLLPGEIAPLVSGQELVLGSRKFRVVIS